MYLHVLVQLIGVLVMLFGLREVFRDIFHPTRSGSLSDFVGWFASLLLRRTPLRPAVGPLALVSVIFCWTATLVFGFALIYCGIPQSQAGIPPGSQVHGLWPRLFQSLYVSLGTFDTFQIFDIKPQVTWFRFTLAFEGFIGISMITASVSWLVLLYPALARVRGFAKRVSILTMAEEATGLSVVNDLGVPTLIEMSQGIVQFRLDVILFPILLNFYAADNSATISSALPNLVRFASEASVAKQRQDVRLAGAQLRIALEELAHTFAERVVKADANDMQAVFNAYRERNQ